MSKTVAMQSLSALVSSSHIETGNQEPSDSRCQGRPHHNGESTTPNDVRMFPRAAAATVKGEHLMTRRNSDTTTTPVVTAKSTSIPITHSERSIAEMQLDHDEALAAYKEICMYRRIVSGNAAGTTAASITSNSSAVVIDDTEGIRGGDYLAHEGLAVESHRQVRSRLALNTTRIPLPARVPMKELSYDERPDSVHSLLGWNVLPSIIAPLIPINANGLVDDHPHDRAFWVDPSTSLASDTDHMPMNGDRYPLLIPPITHALSSIEAEEGVFELDL